MALEPIPANPPSQRLIGPGMAGLFSLIAFASLPLVPIIGVFLAMVAPLPLIHLVATGRPSALGWGWVGVVLVGAALTWQAPWLAALCAGYFLIAAWPAVSVEAWLRHPWSTGRWAAGATLVALAAFAGFLVAMFYPVLPQQALGDLLAKAVTGADEMLNMLGARSVGGEDLFGWAVRATAFLAPAGGALYVLSALLWVRPRLPMLGLPRGAESFAQYTSEEWLPVGFALGGLGWVFATGLTKWVAANLLVTVLGLYFVHGLAIIHFYLGRRLGGNRWVRLAVVVFALQMPVAVVLSALGLVDTFFTLRRGGLVDGGSDE